jgi:hypothetical protein
VPTKISAKEFTLIGKLKIHVFLFNELTVSLLTKVLTLVIESWEPIKAEEQYKSTQCPLPLLSLLEYIQMQPLFVYKDKEMKGARQLGSGGKIMEWYKKHFTCGSITWTVPILGRQLDAPPNPLYESIQGTPLFNVLQSLIYGWLFSMSFFARLVVTLSASRPKVGQPHKPFPTQSRHGKVTEKVMSIESGGDWMSESLYTKMTCLSNSKDLTMQAPLQG